MVSPFDLKKSGVYALAGFIIGLLLLIAVYDYQRAADKITPSLFFHQSSTQNLLIVLLLAVPTICGVVVGGGRLKIKELRRHIGRLQQERERLVVSENKIATESNKLRGLLDQESGLFVDNWDQLITEKDKLREEAEVSSALLRTALAIGNLAEPVAVLDALATALPSALFADDCAIFTWNAKEKAFTSDQVAGVELKPRSFPGLKKLKEERVPLAIDDVEAGGLIPKKIINKFNIKSAILIPCVKRGDVIAVAIVMYVKATHEFTDRDIQIASGIVNPATIVLENADLYAEIIENHTELKRLMTRLAESQEDERRRMARDLHDGVIQNLSGIIFSLSFLGNALNPDQDSARQEIEQLENIVQETISDLRQVIYDLRPTILDSLGLVPTLEKHLDRFAETNNVQTVFNHQLKERVSGVVETALFRLAQEALNNIKKHAGAKKITLDLKESHKKIVMMVKDDGEGFDMEEVKKRVSQTSGFGLSGMKERVQSLQGDVEILSKPGAGTQVKVTVPLEV